MPIATPYVNRLQFSCGLSVAEAKSSSSSSSSSSLSAAWQHRPLAFCSGTQASPRSKHSPLKGASQGQHEQQVDRPPPREQHLILVGGGHAHVQVIKALNAQARPEHLRVTLIDMQKSASYSGMVPGCVAGLYRPDETLLHLEPLAQWAGTTFIHDKVVDIDLERKLVYLQTNPNHPIAFDIISLDIGSTSRDLDAIPGARQYTIPTRPIDQLIQRIDQAGKQWAAEQLSSTFEQQQQPQLVVVGGGAAGIELALAATSRWSRFSPSCTLLDAGETLLPTESVAARQTLKDILQLRRIQVRHNCQVQRVTTNAIVLTSSSSSSLSTPGEAIPYTHCIWATGAGAHPLARQLQQTRNLATTEHGWIQVRSTLQSVSHPFVFAAGDCASIQSAPNVPKAGVYAVRAGPILLENIIRSLDILQTTDEPPSPTDLIQYQPQDDFLKLIVTGDGKALGLRFGLVLYGKWVMQMKDRIDQNFMNLFRILPDPSAIARGQYDTSQYDATPTKNEKSLLPKPADAAALLLRTDDAVDYQVSWGVLRAMTQDVTYRTAVLQEAQSLITPHFVVLEAAAN